MSSTKINARDTELNKTDILPALQSLVHRTIVKHSMGYIISDCEQRYEKKGESNSAGMEGRKVGGGVN